jgi:hypothetical protein
MIEKPGMFRNWTTVIQLALLGLAIFLLVYPVLKK